MILAILEQAQVLPELLNNDKTMHGSPILAHFACHMMTMPPTTVESKLQKGRQKLL